MSCHKYEEIKASHQAEFACDSCNIDYKRRKRDAVTSRRRFGGLDLCVACSRYRKSVDLTGRQFGDLKVTEFDKSTGENRFWLCSCACGGKVSVSTSRLNAGATVKCPECYRAEITDLTGTDVGNLTVLKISHVKSGEKHYICRCLCGNERTCRQFSLTTDLPKLMARECVPCSRKSKQQNVGDVPEYYFKGIRKTAKQREIEYSIDEVSAAELLVRQGYRCALSGLPIGFRVGIIGPLGGRGRCNTATLDRIDNAKCYADDNVQWVHKDLNKLKGTFSDERLIEICRAVAEFQSNKSL